MTVMLKEVNFITLESVWYMVSDRKKREQPIPSEKPPAVQERVVQERWQKKSPRKRFADAKESRAKPSGPSKPQKPPEAGKKVCPEEGEGLYIYPKKSQRLQPPSEKFRKALCKRGA